MELSARQRCGAAIYISQLTSRILATGSHNPRNGLKPQCFGRLSDNGLHLGEACGTLHTVNKVSAEESPSVLWRQWIIFIKIINLSKQLFYYSRGRYCHETN